MRSADARDNRRRRTGSFRAQPQLRRSTRGPAPHRLPFRYNTTFDAEPGARRFG
jgi:hypothetical protein